MKLIAIYDELNRVVVANASLTSDLMNLREGLAKYGLTELDGISIEEIEREMDAALCALSVETGKNTCRCLHIDERKKIIDALMPFVTVRAVLKGK